jgi:3',5'-cyclic AMP phosphodiesterase CpdA
MDPFEGDGLDTLDWAGFDALVIAGDLVNVVLAPSDIRCSLGARLQALVSEA